MKMGYATFATILFDRSIAPALKLVYTESAQTKLQKIVIMIKDTGKNKSYDSILGLSGGVDSSYLTYLVVALGLRPLVIHVDTGWNSEVSEQNIHNLVSKLGLSISDLENLVNIQL